MGDFRGANFISFLPLPPVSRALARQLTPRIGARSPTPRRRALRAEFATPADFHYAWIKRAGVGVAKVQSETARACSLHNARLNFERYASIYF